MRMLLRTVAAAAASLVVTSVLVVGGAADPARAAASPAPATTRSSSLLALRWGDVQATQPALESGAAQGYGYVVLQAWDYGRIPALRAALPGVRILVYKNMSATASYATTGGADNALLPAGVGYEEARAHHPEWFLRDAAGRPVEWADYPGLWPMDVADPGYQSTWLANVSSEVTAHGWDGVMLDDALTRASHPTVGGALPLRIRSDREQVAATRSFLAAVGPRLLKRHQLVVPNASVTWDNYASVYTDWAPFASGWVFEYWAKWGQDSSHPRLTSADLQLRLAIMDLVERTGRFLIPITYGDSSDTATQAYHRAAFLLAWDGGASSSVFSTTQTGASQVLPAAQTDLGRPLRQRYATASGALRRDYTGGTVLLNPDPSRTASATLPRGYTSATGRAVSMVVVPPATAVIVLRSPHGAPPRWREALQELRLARSGGR